MFFVFLNQTWSLPYEGKCLVQLFQTVAGTLNSIDCWVCQTPLEGCDSYLIVIPLNLTDRSIGNSRAWPPAFLPSCKTSVNTSWCLPHPHTIAFTQRSCGADYWWPAQMGQFRLTAFINPFQKQGLGSIVGIELGTLRTTTWMGGHVGTQVDSASQTDIGPTWKDPTIVNNPLYLGALCLPWGLYFICGNQGLICLPPKNMDSCTFWMVK